MESLRSYRTGLGEKTFSWLLRHGKRKEKLCWFFIYPIFPADRKNKIYPANDIPFQKHFGANGRR